MKIETLTQAEEALAPFVEVARSIVGKDITVDRTLRLAECVGNPQQRLKIIHVAGTSGKSSTCYYIAALLGAAEQKVGLTVSPHIASISERVQIDGRNVSEEAFCRYLAEFLVLIDGLPEKPTYFELMMVFALWVFDKEKVDYAVVETGLGGLHDSSNIARRTDKVCVITDIGLDHTEVLGNSLLRVTEQKAGIIWPKNVVFCNEQSSEIMDVIEQKGETQAARIVRLPKQKQSESFLDRNWRLAYEVFESIQQRDGFTSLPRHSRDATREILIPGRMEIIEAHGTTIILDGAHNEQKMNALLASLMNRFPDQKASFLLGFKRSKDINGPVAMIARQAHSVIATSFTVHQDMPTDAYSADEIARRFEAMKISCKAIDNPKEAFRELLDSGAPLIVVTGSFYLVAEIRASLKMQM